MGQKQLSIFCILLFLNIASVTAQKKAVTFSGTIKEPKVKSIQISTAYDLWRNFDGPKETVTDTNGKLHFMLDKPGLYNISTFMRGILAYITPGDQLEFTITPGTVVPDIHFTGKNENNYNYAAENEIRTKKRVWYKKGAALDSFRMEADKWYVQQQAFLDSFHHERPLSKDAYQFYADELKYEYYYVLYDPLRKSVSNTALPGNYFTDLKTHPDTKTLSHLSYYSMLTFVYHHILYGTANPYQQLDSIYKNILTQFTGKTREYMITNLIGVFSKNQQDNYASQLDKIINESPRYVKDTNCLKYIQHCRNEYYVLNKPFPQEVLSGTMLTDFESNQQMTLSEALEKYKGKPVYISFWASWCGACRVDDHDASQAKAYMKEKDIAHLYISLDRKKDEPAWKKAAVEDSIVQHQFLAGNDFQSPIVRFFTIKSIPRHVLLDKDHLLKNIDAPRPNSYQFAEFKRNIDAITAKVVKFN